MSIGIVFTVTIFMVSVVAYIHQWWNSKPRTQAKPKPKPKAELEFSNPEWGDDYDPDPVPKPAPEGVPDGTWLPKLDDEPTDYIPKETRVPKWTPQQVTAVKPLLDLIAQGESRGSYNAMNNGTVGRIIMDSSYTPEQAAIKLGAPLIMMTMREVRQLQAGTRSTGRKLFAAGRYQIIPSTMTFAMQKAEVKKDDLFDEATQDQLAMSLVMVKRPALGKYLGGGGQLRAAMLDLAREWASFPHPDTGNSYYGSGNKSSHTRHDVTHMLDNIREVYSAL